MDNVLEADHCHCSLLSYICACVCVFVCVCMHSCLCAMKFRCKFVVAQVGNTTTAHHLFPMSSPKRPRPPKAISPH